MNDIKQAECWITTDHRLFTTLSEAKRHQQDINACKLANDRLRNGASIAECLRCAGCNGAIDPILEKVTKDTKLVIPHWQCSDVPGYQVRWFNVGLSMYVSGNVGSWSGAYGSNVSTRKLAEYAKHSKTVFEVQA